MKCKCSSHDPEVILLLIEAREQHAARTRLSHIILAVGRAYAAVDHLVGYPQFPDPALGLLYLKL